MSTNVPLLVLTFEEARRVVETQAATFAASGIETVELLAAAGRVLGEDLLADRDVPPFPRSTRDGYAVRSRDCQAVPASLAVIGEIKAGESLENIPTNVDVNQAVAIMTGAPVPVGTDAVVMVEHTSQSGDHVSIARAVTAGENIVPRGA